MQELRLVAVSEDGSYAVLTVPGRSGRFALPIDDRLRTVARGQFSRLAQYEIEVESPLRPKEIQDRIRAGETAEEIADAAGLAVDRIKRFEGPPLAERARWAQEAQKASVRGGSDPLAGPGPRLGEIVTRRLVEAGASLEEAEWDSRKRHDGFWQVQLAYTVAGRMRVAEWVFDPKGSHVTPDDDESARLCLDETDWPSPRPMARQTATVTPIGPRVAGAHGARGTADRRDAETHPSRQGTSPAPAGMPAVPVHPSRQASATPRQSGAGPRRAEPSRQAPAAEMRPAEVPASEGTGSRGSVLRTSRPSPAEAQLPPAQPAASESAVSRSAPDAVTARAEEAGARAPAGARHARTQKAKRGPAKSGDQTSAAGRDGNPRQDAEREAGGPARPSRGGRKGSSGRSRRSSVPSWDEIMFGTSRQPE